MHASLKIMDSDDEYASTSKNNEMDMEIIKKVCELNLCTIVLLERSQELMDKLQRL